MNNVVVMRLLVSLAIMAATIVTFLGFYFLKFPVSVVVAIFAIAFGVGIPIFFHRKEKSARFDIYYRAVQELGSPINFGGSEAAFERDGTRFDVEFPRGEHQAYYKINFHLPNIRQKFSIQYKSLLVFYHDDCQVIQETPLPEYVVQSRNPAFLINFLQNRQIRDAVLNCQSSMWGGARISFNDGSFEIIWMPPVSEQIEGLYQICHSAAVFHDELKRVSELPR